MAETGDADHPQESRSRWVAAPNRVPAAVMVGLVIVFLVGALLVSATGKKTLLADPGVRGLVVPTADRARTVVVPPCGTGVRITARNVAAQPETPGATVVQLPPGERPRVVLIPRCSASTKTAGAKAVTPVPSSLFVLPLGARTAAAIKGTTGDAPIQPRTQLIVPTASEADLVVVPPCRGTSRAEKAIALSPRPGSPTALIAPAC